MTLAKKIWLMLSAIILTTVVAAGIYLSTTYFFSTSELAKTFKNYRGDSQVSTAIQNTEPFSILLMGVDTGSESRQEQWVGNSDSMIIVTVNPQTNRTTITSLERDILVELIDEKGKSTDMQAKLNAAYANGGASMAIETIEALLDIPIDYYMQINMQGLVDLVDAVGGITVTNDFDYPIKIYDWEPEYTATVEPGTHKVNGEQALVYSRMRYDDPEGDYGRQRRQRVVIGKILDKLLALDSISNYRRILQAVSSNMQTDIEITSATIPSLLNYREAFQMLENNQLYGEDAEINGGSYQIVTAKHLLEIQNKIKKELGLETKKTLKTNAILYEALYGGDTLADESEEKDTKKTESELDIVDVPSADGSNSSTPRGDTWLDTWINDLGEQGQSVEQPVYNEVYTPQTSTEQISYSESQPAQTVTETYEQPVVEQPIIVEQPVVTEQPVIIDDQGQ